MLAITYSRASCGIDAPLVTVETHLTKGMPGLAIVGLPETVVKESKHRVRSAILNANFEFPISRIVVNLAPADLPKEGGRFDLAIALGILAASKQIPLPTLTEYEFAGELALSGELRSVRGMLPFALATQHDQKRKIIVAADNAAEAALIDDIEVLSAKHLLDVCAHLTEQQKLTVINVSTQLPTTVHYPDLTDVHGQSQAKRGLEIAAAGGHSMLMVGPPGTGKTMLAQRLPGILPPLTEQQALEVAAIASIAQTKFNTSYWRKRPFRAPHHTASSVALVGGGSIPRPGEISLAHQGILFLDELPEFSRHVLDSLREPLGSGYINVSRAARQVQFPAKFQLIAAMNPCPCGNLTDQRQLCRCTEQQVQRYQARISGPLFDRIDLHVNVDKLSDEVLLQTPVNNESSAKVRQRVCQARDKQLQRCGKLNSELDNDARKRFCALGDREKALLAQAIKRLDLSARACHRLIKVARTIADLAEQDSIKADHLTEALSYRQKVLRV